MHTRLWMIYRGLPGDLAARRTKEELLITRGLVEGPPFAPGEHREWRERLRAWSKAVLGLEGAIGGSRPQFEHGTERGAKGSPSAATPR